MWKQEQRVNDASISQGTSRLSGKNQKLKKARKDSFLQISEIVWPW
jgi:hypothetical protein